MTGSMEEYVGLAYEKALTAYKPWHQRNGHPIQLEKAVLFDSALHRNEKRPVRERYYAAMVL